MRDHKQFRAFPIDEPNNQQHEIYELSREKHIPIKQIAEQLDLSEQTVKNYLTSALKILRSEMMKYNILFIFFL